MRTDVSLTAPTPPALTVEAAAAGEKQPVLGRHPRLRTLFTRWGAEVGVLAFVGLVVPLALGAYYGTLSAPSSDDWAYDLAVFHLAHTGHLFLYHWITINFVGQAVLALPFVLLFGAHIAVLNTWTCCVGCCGLLALCHLGRSIGLPRNVALAASAFVGLTPVWLEFSVSFMTDVPAMTFMALALAVAAADRRTDRYVTPHAVAALVFGFVAFTIRETTCPVLVAIVLVRAWRCGRPSLRALRGWLLVASTFAFATVLEYAWRHTLPGEGYQPPPIFRPIHALSTGATGWEWPLAGLLLFPAILYADGARAVERLSSAHPRRAALVWLLVPGLPYGARLVITLRLWESGPTPTPRELLSNFLLPFGDQAFNVSPIGAATPAWGWILAFLSVALTVATLLSWMMLTALLAERLQPGSERVHLRTWPDDRRRALRLTGALATLLFIGLFSIQFPLFERDEMLALVPLGLSMLARRNNGPRYGAGLAAVAVLCVSVLVSTSAIADAGGSWRSAQHFARSHPSVPRTDISAGYVWDSYQARTIVFQPAHSCYTLVTSPKGAPLGVSEVALRNPLEAAVLGFLPAARPLPAYCTGFSRQNSRPARRSGEEPSRPTTARH